MAEKEDIAVLQRVADHVVAQTTRRLVDRTSGAVFTDSTGLPLKSEVTLESKFNAWYYQTWLLTDGMRRAAGILTDPACREFGERNLDFLYQHLPDFERQEAAGLKAAPIGDGKLSPVGFYFALAEPWHTGLAPLVLERWSATRDARCEPYLRRLEDQLRAATRTSEGALYRPNGRLMADDPYMLVPCLVRTYRDRRNSASLDEAVNQILGARTHLFVSEKGLYRHAWHVLQNKPLGLPWGRANGWMILAQVELLAGLPAGHARAAEVRHAFAEHAAGLARWQDPAGGWHQLLDQPETWIETSCTGMFVYGLARGVIEGWLGNAFAAAARKGWRALLHKVTADGDLVEVCGSTDIGDANYYRGRPRLQGDLHGFGPFLLAGSEIVRLQRKNAKPQR